MTEPTGPSQTISSSDITWNWINHQTVRQKNEHVQKVEKKYAFRTDHANIGNFPVLISNSS